jgi:hypothetical protein
MKRSLDSNHFFGTVIKLEAETSPRIPNEFFACHNPYSKNELEMRLVRNRKLFENS